MIISPVSEQTFPLRPNQLPRSSVDWNERLLNRGIPDIETDENFQTTTGSGVVEVPFINQFSFVYTFSTFERNFCLTRIFLLLARFPFSIITLSQKFLIRLRRLFFHSIVIFVPLWYSIAWVGFFRFFILVEIFW